MDEFLDPIIRAAVTLMGRHGVVIPTPPERMPCVRHALAGAGYVFRCYACEIAHEPKLAAWLSTIETE